MKAPKRERGADRAFEEQQQQDEEDRRAATRPRMIELRQVGGASPRWSARLRPRAGPRFRLLAAARAARRALGVDAAALGAAVLAAALLLGLGHRLESSRSRAAGREPPLDHVRGRVEAADRHVLRVAGERRRRDQADQLGLDRPGAERRGQLAHRARRPRQRHRERVVDVGRDLGAAAARAAGRSPARPAGRRPTRAAPAATARATSRSPLSSSTLKAASGGRAVTRVAPARAVRQRRARSRGAARPPPSAASSSARPPLRK